MSFRYTAIKHPLMCLPKRATIQTTTPQVDVKRVMLYAIGVLAFALAYSAPMFLEYESKVERGIPRVFWTELRSSSSYTMFYTIYGDLIVRMCVPLSLLIKSNLGIYNLVKQRSDLATKDKQIAVMLFGVVVLLVSCHSPRFMHNVYNAIILDNLSCCQNIDPSLGSSRADQIAHVVAKLLLVIQR